MWIIAGAWRSTARNDKIVESAGVAQVRCVIAALLFGLVLVLIAMGGLAVLMSTHVGCRGMRTPSVSSSVLVMATAPEYRVRRKRDESQYVSEFGEHGMNLDRPSG